MEARRWPGQACDRHYRERDGSVQLCRQAAIDDDAGCREWIAQISDVVAFVAPSQAQIRTERAGLGCNPAPAASFDIVAGDSHKTIAAKIARARYESTAVSTVLPPNQFVC